MRILMNKLARISLLAIFALSLLPLLRAQQPATTTPAPDAPQKSGAEANPFPEDTTDVPVMATHPEAAPAAAADDNSAAPAEAAHLPTMHDEADPIASPDADEVIDPTAQGSSSSLSGMNDYQPKEEDEKHSRHRTLSVKQPTQQEVSAKDVEIGDYYLERKNWKAALSRFESALILDPENPEVYWGLALSHHKLGDLAQARENYQKLLDYDPDGPHGKESRKAMKDPAIANAVAQQPKAEPKPEAK